MAAPFSTVAFPSSSDPVAKPVQATPYPRPPHLPFRRISLPTAPTLMHRQSIVSVASFDSLPEEELSPISPVPALMRNVNAGRRNRAWPGSSEGNRRGNRRREPRPQSDSVQEPKRQKVIQEFYETEKAYVDGLELIYSHFLTPIIASLDTPQPLLDRAVLTSVFSNFIDIWNLHRSFFSSLSSLLFTDESPFMTTKPLSPVLLSHFPYLSLYTPFITSFPSTISSIADLITPPSAYHPNALYNQAFATFLSTQELDPRCGKLKLRDWLLTVVQRCPRYLLLLKDLIECTDPEDSEHEQLTAVHTLVSKITLSLNTSLHTHAQTLSLLALQRATPNLPFQLISPGRTLLKRGSLIQIERSHNPKEREFLLFSDCLIWLEDSERAAWKTDWGIGRSGWTNNNNSSGSSPATPDIPGLPEEERGRVVRPPIIRTRSKSEAELSVAAARFASKAPPPSPSKSKSVMPPMAKRYHHPSSSNMLKRQASNVIEEKWIYKGRAELVDLEIVVTPPREEGEERRCEILSPEGSFVLYADSEAERDQWCSTIRQAKAQLMISLNITHPNSTLTSSSSTNHIRRTLQALPFPPEDEKKPKAEKRRWVEHWVPAIWIPDEKAEGCMRCGRSFGWRRRRHHCRLCGRCVCAACSDRTFFIADSNGEEPSGNPARACTACYETVFPLIDPEAEESDEQPQGESQTYTNSLTNYPSWLSMPSLPLTPVSPESLMAFDKRPLARIEDDEVYGPIAEKRERLRMKSPSSRPRSYHQILEDFADHDNGILDISSPLEEGESEVEEGDDSSSSKRHTVTLSSSPRNEDTARRNKRFSLPAVALQTTSVTARTHLSFDDNNNNHNSNSKKRESQAPSKRFSLMLHGRNHVNVSEIGKKKGHSTGDSGDLGRGVAAGKLSELLGKKRVVQV
ncbi:hypothetical protein C8J56DRAFT_1014515 [Mycena floridula]|nr:hypothetical protein C8J56DRAFT_1014515 [Mycena floridula]